MLIKMKKKVIESDLRANNRFLPLVKVFARNCSYFRNAYFLVMNSKRCKLHAPRILHQISRVEIRHKHSQVCFVGLFILHNVFVIDSLRN